MTFKSVRKKRCTALLCALSFMTLSSFTLVEHASVKVKTPSFTKATITLFVGQTKTNKVKNCTNYQIQWKSQKKSIATVKKNGKSSCKIKAIKAGKAKIYAIAKKGKKKYTLSCKVTVKAKKTVPTSVTTVPTVEPTATPTIAPTIMPTKAPTATPTTKPTATPITSIENNRVSLTKTNQAQSGALKGSPAFHEDGSVSYTAQNEYGGGGLAFYLNPEKRPVFLRDYTSVIYTVSSSEDNTPIEFFYTDTTKNGFWDRQTLAYNTISKEKSTFSFPIENTRDILSFGLKMNSNGCPYDNATLTIHSITFVKVEPKDLVSMKSVTDPVWGYTGCSLPLRMIRNDGIMEYSQKHFSTITVENEMKPGAIMAMNEKVLIPTESAQKNKDNYVIPDSYKEKIIPTLTYEDVDYMLGRCKEYGLKLRFHTLLWGTQIPEYFFHENYEEYAPFVSKEVMNGRIEMYVRSVIHHIYTVDDGAYRDVVYAWDVVNEALHAGPTDPWNIVYGDRIAINDITVSGTYIKVAFAAAYQELKKVGMENSAVLFYNDFNCYDDIDYRLSLVDYVNKKDDINVNGEKILQGIGMQAHLSIDYPSDPTTLAKAAKRYLDAGLEVQLTELDVCTNMGPNGYVNLGQTDEQQAAYIKKMTEALIDLQKAQKEDGKKYITSVTWWNMYDYVSWRGGETNSCRPLLFGKDYYDTKPSYYAFMEAFENAAK